MALWSDDDVAREEAAREKKPESAARALALVAAALVLVLAAGTIYGLAAGTRAKKLEREAGNARAAVRVASGASFTGIGTIRAKSADAKAAVVVATIAFPYDSGDRSFAEELSRKAPVLKAAAESLISAKKAADLAPAYEGSLKAALRDAFNARLSLGKVTEIWLSDFVVIR